MKTTSPIRSLILAKRAEFISSEDVAEHLEDQQWEQYGAYISTHFADRFVNVYLSEDFTVYCSSRDDAEKARQTAISYGFKHIELFVPRVADPSDKMKTIDDPDHAFAVRVHESESLIFGNHAEKWLKLHKHITYVVQDHIIYTYCYNTDARFKFASKEAAEVLHSALQLHYAKIEEVAVKQVKEFPKMKITLEPCSLSIDNWVVELDFDKTA